MAQLRQNPNPKALVESENASLPSRARARKRVIKGSVPGADNDQEVTTAKASMATIDVRQVEQNAQRRTLRVAVLAFALLVAASAVVALFAGSSRRVGVPQLPNWPQSSALVQRPGTSAQASITIRFRPGVSRAME